MLESRSRTLSFLFGDSSVFVSLDTGKSGFGPISGGNDKSGITVNRISQQSLLQAVGKQVFRTNHFVFKRCAHQRTQGRRILSRLLIETLPPRSNSSPFNGISVHLRLCCQDRVPLQGKRFLLYLPPSSRTISRVVSTITKTPMSRSALSNAFSCHP
jgi:hypothetical protein